ncbi:ArsR/SmtB family transcription factor [Yinghuangia seranimata]|uniref:ArsR/SmtB family transcription factor n=1 Tax=Yinghuangia seranimata TaxID=408067 RepID=UPI00248AD407|nr:metalloregulator ArsR/SmtB family transcription factor [Yinghuangia seranimata]MDI2125840.1 metalloregulator ArsR/SmtB family transcription factor [Yinghuangia seranimata]
MPRQPKTNDPVLRALAHPTRLRMMSLLWATPQSAAELARELGVSQALASHHLRTLDAAGLLVLTETRSTRGGAERRYQAVRGTPLADQQVDMPLLAETLAHNLRERAGRRAPDAPGVTTDAELWLKPADWDALRTRLAALMTELHEAAHAPHAEGTVPIGGTVVLFLMTDEPAPQPTPES